MCIITVCNNVCSVGGGGVMSDDRSGHRTGHWTLSPVRVSAQNAAIYRKPAQTLPQCAPANEILFRRRGHVRSEVTLAVGQTKICALKCRLEAVYFSFIVKLRQGSDKDGQGMAFKAKGLKA